MPVFGWRQRPDSPAQPPHGSPATNRCSSPVPGLHAGACPSSHGLMSSLLFPSLRQHLRRGASPEHPAPTLFQPSVGLTREALTRRGWRWRALQAGPRALPYPRSAGEEPVGALFFVAAFLSDAGVVRFDSLLLILTDKAACPAGTGLFPRHPRVQL